MIAAIALLLTTAVHAGVVGAPVELGRLPFSAASSAASPMPVLPPYLSVANPADGALLAGIIQAAQASPTAVAVLAQVAQAAEVRGRPVVVEVLKMKESGTYNLDWGILSLRRRDMKDSPRANVSTLIHELQHLLQTQRQEIPSDLLETELEAYVVDFRVSRELNDKPKTGSYDARAQAAFKDGLEPFMGFLRKQYPEDAQLHKTKARDYENRLRDGLAESTAKLEGLEIERAERLRVLEQMRGLGHGESELTNYRQDAIAPLDAAIQTMNRAIEWARKDIAILASPETRAQARAYARSVIRRARAFQKIFSRG
jgi:GNAT superfamily N-acetyltransferase